MGMGQVGMIRRQDTGDIPILTWSTYVQNLTLDTPKTKNQKTLTNYHDSRNTPKCMTFAPLWSVPKLFLNTK